MKGTTSTARRNVSPYQPDVNQSTKTELAYVAKTVMFSTPRASASQTHKLVLHIALLISTLTPRACGTASGTRAARRSVTSVKMVTNLTKKETVSQQCLNSTHTA